MHFYIALPCQTKKKKERKKEKEDKEQRGAKKKHVLRTCQWKEKTVLISIRLLDQQDPCQDETRGQKLLISRYSPQKTFLELIDLQHNF